ncbi:PaaI family thioesterase [Brevibacterium aurantiacum]|uniref:Uncharacterized protein n=1 Tax=Brevibacterium aurantiacum TaxID=273384 RepID=A0A4Z0KEG6_BREAU|nr:hotdog domain-containing protein [Brevibacterium aurantiacum]TGD37026.1 hypothetical protein EB834_17090 [Brevibacterium aurantiacum]
MDTLLYTASGPVEKHYAVGNVEIADGHAEAEAAIGPWSRQRDGRFAPGVIGPLVDMAWSQAVLSHRPEGQWGVSSEISVDFVAEPSAEGRMRASGVMLSVDSTGGVARGEVHDDSGALVAVGTLWSVFIDGVPDSITTPTDSGPAGELGATDEVEELQRAFDRSSTCFEELVALRPEDDGLVLEQRPQMTNPLGVGHGGALFAAAALAATNAAAATNVAHSTDDVHLESLRGVYVRPAVGDVTISSEVQHAGRKFTTLRVTATGADGRPAAYFTASMRKTQPCSA